MYMLREDGIIYYGDEQCYKRPMKKNYFKKKLMRLEKMVEDTKRKDIRKEEIENLKKRLKEIESDIESNYFKGDKELEKIFLDMKLSYQKQIELWENKTNEEIMIEKEKQISSLEKIIRKTKREEINNPSKRVKKCRKKIPHKKLKEMILSYIDNLNNLNNKDCIPNYITKEEISQKFNVKESDVELVFMELNKEGILSQRVSRYAHDTNRNPMFPMDISGWSADWYYIRNTKTKK